MSESPDTSAPAYNSSNTMTTGNVGKAVMVPAIGNIFRNRIVRAVISKDRRKKKHEAKRESRKDDK